MSSLLFMTSMYILHLAGPAGPEPNPSCYDAIAIAILQMFGIGSGVD